MSARTRSRGERGPGPRCPVGDCDARRGREHLMCRSCWRLVPRVLRDEVWAAYREEGVLSERYLQARETAIAAVSA
jgi:hypothetical protein